jgi:maleamate amidohydrolase
MSEELNADYAAAGFNRRLGFGRQPALLVVDFVKAYLTPGHALYAGVEDALAAAEQLLVEARAAGIPVVFTQVHYDNADEGGPFFRKVAGLQTFVGDDPAAEICEPLTPLPGEHRLLKKYASAFFDTGLRSTLNDLRVDSVLISGLSTSGCVRATALDAVQSGFIPLVVREAVGDRAAGPHEASLFDLDAKYADVVSLAEAVDHLHSIAPVAS